MRHEDTSSSFRARQDRLRALMEAHRLPLLLVTHLVNVRYLTGFTGSAGILLLGPREGWLWVDPRYTLQAGEQAVGVEVIEEKKGILPGAAKWLGKSGAREVAFEASNLTCEQFDRLREKVGGEIQFKPAGDLIEELRVVKDRGEIEAMRRAGKLTAVVFAEVLPHVRPGVEENELAAEIEFKMRTRGAEGAAFGTIVASGARGAFPHARPSSKALQQGELVIFDLGAIVDGYAADMTRTVYLGQPNRRVQSLYAAVVKAQEGAVREVQDTVTAGEIDSAARRILARYRLSRFFTHSTGHGVGLEVHERPRLGKGETTCLRSGSVVTIEPGVYMKGLGGIRIEDTVLVCPQGPEVLTPAPKDYWVIG